MPANKPLQQQLFLFAAFGCVGITTEIFFTAVVDNINALQAGNHINWRLLGQSYIWMFPIYGLAGILFPLLYKHISHWHIVLRVLLYATAIISIEFITGALLDKFTGQCPWQYKTGWQVMGYIRLDYYPLWMGFGLAIELIYRYLDGLLTGKQSS